MPQGGARSTGDVGCGITDHGIGRYRPTPPTGPTQTTPRTNRPPARDQGPSDKRLRINDATQPSGAQVTLVSSDARTTRKR